MSTEWITSMAEFRTIILPILTVAKAEHLCEIGAQCGLNSQTLADFLRPNNGKLITIDPKPQPEFLTWVNEARDVVTHIQDYSLKAIPALNASIDAWLIDGDHNWYTVFHELALIEAACQRNQKPLLVFLHDISWPCSRRDLYFDPMTIPAEFRQACSNQIGIALGNTEYLKKGGGLKGDNWALKSGGLRNGVLTAVEDFLKNSQGKYHFINIPALLGLGIIINENHPALQQIVNYTLPYHNNAIMARMECDRIAKYIALCSLSESMVEIAEFVKKAERFCKLNGIDMREIMATKLTDAAI